MPLTAKYGHKQRFEAASERKATTSTRALMTKEMPSEAGRDGESKSVLLASYHDAVGARLKHGKGDGLRRKEIYGYMAPPEKMN